MDSTSTPTRLRRCQPVASLLLTAWMASSLSVGPARAEPYNPYAESHDVVPHVAADGTLHWGTFYKSAAMQKSYERLWSMGACRGTNKAITVPVERNKMVIDNLPEASFRGRALGSAGTIGGGLVAFTEGDATDTESVPLVAQLHPSGATTVQIGGRTSLASVRPGIVVRLRATVDEKGRGADPLRTLDIVTPPDGFKADPVRAHALDTMVGTVVQMRRGILTVHVDAGRIRRLVLPVADDAEVMIVDAAQIDLIEPGDEVEVVGRRWSGAGSMGAGTVFASKLVVNKRPADVSGRTPHAAETLGLRAAP